MRLIDHLSEEQLRELNVKSQQLPDKKKVHHKKVDWKYIMGMNRDTYRRKGGAIRKR
jgi:hypothetical protein